MGLGRPGPVGELQPVPLDLLAGRVVDLDRRSAPDPGACLAMRAKGAAAQLAGEDLVAALVAEGAKLVVERRRPQVGILAQALPDVRLERGEVVGHGGPALAGAAGAGQVGPDRAAITAQVAGDGRDRPPPLS